jgi:hypothetical protein
MSNELQETKNKESYAMIIADAATALQSSEDLDGLPIKFPRIKIPSGGGLAFELPGDSPESPDLAKEIKAVILYHHPINTYYKDKYTGGSNPPDCGSINGKVGMVAATGEIKHCDGCPYNEFGSGENGAKACKQKRRLYLLRDGDALPTILTIPTGSLNEFSNHIMRLLSKGKKSNMVVTKFTLKKAQNKGGITYSQAVFATDRVLRNDEYAAVQTMSAQIKSYAAKEALVDYVDEDDDNPFKD